MQVCKDAASASIYESRAANGVIVITTKKGKSGSSKLAVDVFYGNSSPSKIPETLNPNEFLEVQQKLAAGQGLGFTSNITSTRVESGFFLITLFADWVVSLLAIQRLILLSIS